MNKLLVVDNLEFFLVLVKSLLQDHGCTILTATNAEDALEIIREEKPQLILLDQHLHQMSGDEICKELKKSPETKDIHVIILSTSKETADREKCFRAGCDEYLIKPIEQESFFNTISKYMSIVKRAYNRVPIYESVTYSHDGTEYAGHIHIIAKGGACLKGEHVMPVGAILRLEFQISKLQTKIDVLGKVVWNSDSKEMLSESDPELYEMGIQFMNLSEHAKNAIVRYIAFGNYSE